MESPSRQTDVKNGEHKLWLPEWMVHNIERLNTTADFDHYACSPLEPEGYLSDPCQNENKETTGNSSQENHALSNVELESSYKPTADILPNKNLDLKALHGGKLMSKHQLLINAIKHEDILYSSPDTTPCVTPEPSPAPRRKISLTNQETVQTSPQKWFYLGPSKTLVKCKQILSKGNIETTNLSNISNNTKVSQTSSSSSVKLSISNFDLNAISPSSW